MKGKLETPFRLAGKRVWVAGHRGMVGSATVRRLADEDCEILTVTRDELDLRDQAAVGAWIIDHKPNVIIEAAAKVGGILANSTHPAEFIYDNLAIGINIINGAHRAEVEKLLFLGSACIYPREAAQPIKEEDLLSGPLEPTNQWYAVAKIAGIKLCQAYRHQYGHDFISAQPNNLYGPGDNFDLMSSHVVPALMAKAHNAKLEADQNLEIWGSGTPRREFLHVDDVADACIHLLKYFSGEIQINIGTGEEVTIRELAYNVAQTVGFDGDLVFDTSKPDGAPRKLLDVNRMKALGWQSTIALQDGLKSTYDWYLDNIAN